MQVPSVQVPLNTNCPAVSVSQATSVVIALGLLKTHSATTGNFVSYSNSAITADHVIAECVFANTSAITSNVSWTTANGSLILNGTCSTATTVNVVLVKKDN